MKEIGMWKFVKTFWHTGNFYDTAQALEDEYHDTDFSISLPYLYRFLIIQNEEQVRHLLKSKMDLGFQYDVFNVAHSHELNVVAMQAFQKDGSTQLNPLWHLIHVSLANSLGDSKSIKALIAKHIPKFFSNNTFTLDTAFENFMLDFWCEFMFGDKVDAEKFKVTRNKLLETLRYTYYGSRIKNLPFIGTQACRFYRYLKKKELAELDQELQAYISDANGGLIGRLRQKLTDNPSFPQNKIDKAVLDNAFIFVLVFDFIQNALYETLVSIVKNQIDDQEQRKKTYTEGLHRAYLFPFRSRKALETITLSNTSIAAGETVYLNLLKSGIYHSFGPRACYGMAMTNWIKDAVFQHLVDRKLRLVSTSYPAEREALSHSKDIPISPERYEVSWQFTRDYLQKRLPHKEFKGVKEFFDVLQIHHDPALTKYLASEFIQKIESANLDKSKLCIVVPEMRGIPVATAVHTLYGIPLEFIRKPGKIPGKVIQATYENAYSKEEGMEIAEDSLIGKDVIFIDDGIASGGTTVTGCKLAEQAGGKVKMVLAIINHTYKTRTPEYVEFAETVPVHTLFDFAAKAPTAEVKLEEKSNAEIMTSGANSLYRRDSAAATPANTEIETLRLAQ